MYTLADLNDLYDLLIHTTDEKLVSDITEAIHIVEFELYNSGKEVDQNP
jgi:hypothetical protein